MKYLFFSVSCIAIFCQIKAELVDSNPCRQPPDSGPCNRRINSWFYDFDLGFCLPFYYGGCHGNDNKFPTKSVCERLCSGRGHYGGGYLSRPRQIVSYSSLPQEQSTKQIIPQQAPKTRIVGGY